MQFSSTGRADSFLPIFVFTFTCLLFFYSSASSQISDKSVLLDLKAALSDPEGILSSWISTDSSDDLGHCSWHGVVCGPNSRVSAIAIIGGGKRDSGGNREKVPCFDVSKFPFYGFGIRRACSAGNGKLSGDLPSVIAKLTEIRVLSLPFHELAGEIPSEIWGLRNLEVLDLEGNSLTGNLPVSFEGLRKLRVLNLGLNEIGGEIPDSLSKCMKLQVLNLAGNQLRGPVPRFIGMFSELSGLHLSSNSLEGVIPAELGHNCKNLQYLDLSRNAFTGAIPLELGNCQQLRALLLFSNQLQGFMPDTFGQLRMLEVLDVSWNSLSGPISPELGNCTNLSVLVLSRLYDPLPSMVNIRTDSTDSSRSSSGQSNSFDGTIPEEVSSLARLKVLWAPAASLKGEIPRSWGKGVEVINLSHNFFTGGIKWVFRGCKNLRFVDLSTNKLTGGLDSKLSVPCMIVFDVSRNMFSGSIPRFRNGVCGPVFPQVSELEQLDGPSSAYLSFLTSEFGVNDPTLNAKLAVVHNFGQNNFTGGIPSLPIADSRLVNIADYAFLADGNKLTGIFPGRLFDSCHKLNGMFVDVSNNRLSGRVPVGLSAICRSLRFLDASGNKISGFVPRRHGNMESLVLLDMNLRDGLTEIPVSLGRLNYLYYYNLSKNRLQGGVPYRLRQLPSVKISEISPSSLVIDILLSSSDLRNLTVLVFNINELSVQIRSGIAEGNSLSASHGLAARSLLEANSVKCSSAFGSCHILDNSSTSYSSVQSSPEDLQSDSLTGASSYGGGNKFNSIEIASIVSASAIVLVLLALIVLFIYTRKYAPKGGSRVQVLEKKEIKVFIDIGVSLTFPNIVKATECFSTRNCIGSGGFGSTYRAEVSPGVSVAVKRLAVGRVHCIQQFDAEIKTLGRIRHNNLVTLIGYHASETEMFLIYNYLPGGNLEKFIQDRPTRPVNWKVLHKIALDIAHALAYLHDSCDPRVIHRDVKPSNVLLDNNFNAYLSDFGLSRLLGNSETHATTGVEGTFGYLAPEYAMTCRVSEKADVYSYGVVLLELLSDKRALDPSFSAHGDGFNIVSWACMLLRQGRAKEVFTAGLWDSGPRDDLVEVLHLAVKCTLETLSIRPTMKQVVQRLKQLRPVS